MKKIGTSVERWFSNHFPELYLRLIQHPRNYSRFRVERKLSSGAHISQSDKPSILFFTTQKCASRYVDGIISRLATTAGLVHADYDAYQAMVPMPVSERPFANERNLRIAFHARGYYYGPIGSYRDIPDLDQYRIAVQLRDPRDVLTSLYYSTAFSHAIINPKIIRRRKEALGMDVNRFVLNAAEDYVRIYSRYCESLLGREWVVFLRYEDMVADFPGWLQRLSEHVYLDHEKQGLENIRNEANFSVTREDKFSQRRQVTPGDYLRKLDPEIIQQLNERFKPVLETLGYTVELQNQ